MRSVIKTILLAPLAVLVLAVLLGFFFAAPVALIGETIDLLRMRSTTTATVTSAEIIAGRKGTRPHVEYQFVVNEVNYTSNRFAPGWFANSGSWTGGGRGIKTEFNPGQIVTIHYSSADPSHACLEYGWFKWSVGFTLGFWGMVFSRLLRPGRQLRSALGSAMTAFGLGLIILGPDVIPVAQLQWYTLAFAAVCGFSVMYLRFRSQRPGLSSRSVD